MNSIDLHIDSFDKIQKGTRWLRENIDFSEERIKSEWEEIIARHGKDDSILPDVERYNNILEIKCDVCDFLPIYTLSFFNDQIVEEFKETAKKDNFWIDASIMGFYPGEEQFFFWNFLYEMGFSSNRHFMEYFDKFKKEVTEGGRFWNDYDQACFLRLLIALEPHSTMTEKILKYCLENDFHLIDSPSSSVFILALTELNYSKYSETISEGIKFIKERQNDDGSWGKNQYNKFQDIYFAIKAICRINGKNEEELKRGIKFLLDTQKDDGGWGEKWKKWDTSFAIMSLLAVSPPFSICTEEYMFSKQLQKQDINLHKPYFIHTSPIYDEKMHVKEIYEKILTDLNAANSTIRIISPYIDMFYEEIINLKNTKPSLNIKIITRPKKDIKGMRERIAKNVLDLLTIATSGNLKTLDIIHSRLIIIDDKELIISSADLTREGLFDEFNAGIFTNDEDTIKNSINYFENIWRIDDEKTQI